MAKTDCIAEQQLVSRLHPIGGSVKNDDVEGQFVKAPSFNLAAGNVGAGSPVFMAAPAGTIYYTTDGSDPRQQKNNGAVAPGASTYTGAIKVNGAVTDNTFRSIVIGSDSGATLTLSATSTINFDNVAAGTGRVVNLILTDAINRLPDRERLVITLYYFEGLTLAEIGDVLGVTESRVCQIHAKSVLSLRNRMAEPSFR